MDDAIRQLDDTLVSRYRSDTGLFEELKEQQIALGITHEGRPICPFLRPYFIGGRKYSEIRSAAASIYGAFERLVSAALSEPSIAAKLGLTEKEERWARLEPGYRGISVNSRLDTFLNPHGFKFLEYNGENPAGVGDQPSLTSLFRRIKEVDEFLQRHEHHHPEPHRSLLRGLDSAYREFGGKTEKPGIAIVDWQGVATGAEFEILQEFFESEGYRSRICHPDELEYDGATLRAEDFEIDIFYKRVIIHEFLERYDETHPLYRACEDGNVCMANSFRSKIPHKKSSFAVLSDPAFRHLFTPQQISAIENHIPWTRVVEPVETYFDGGRRDLLELLRAERERFVLKPNDDYGGHGIVLGWESGQSEWDDAIARALESPYVVQERVEVEKTDIPMVIDGEATMASLLVDFDPFLFNGEVEGGMVRLSSASLVNITQGGGETGLVVLRDM